MISLGFWNYFFILPASVAAATRGDTVAAGFHGGTLKTPVLIGQRYGQLTVVSEAYRKKGFRSVDVTCDCGRKKTVHTAKLVGGQTVSCGHVRQQQHQSFCKRTFKKPL